MSQEEKEVKLTRPVVQVLGISCLSASISTVLTQPLEVIKTRLQAQTALRSQSTSGVFNTTNQIWQDSRLLSKGNSTLLAPPLGVRVRIFWSGTVPALWRCVPGIALYFSTLNLLEGHFPKSVGLCVYSTLVLISFSFDKVGGPGGIRTHASKGKALVQPIL
uniref:Solute carrier family 25 member 38 n=1 Tax=Schistocephalus solidus TaxID=70667 RepID=A0A0X3PVU6_SCHSO